VGGVDVVESGLDEVEYWICRVTIGASIYLLYSVENILHIEWRERKVTRTFQ